jgi:SAM-dependent methyltransferase
MLKAALKSVLGSLGLTLSRASVDPACEGFDVYLRRANEQGLDLNDWLESEHGWESAEELLGQQSLFPEFPEGACVLEIGSGTGRHARHLAARLPRGRLICVDHSPWCRRFLADYFRGQPQVEVRPMEGWKLPAGDGELDMVFSNGTFIELKLGTIHRFVVEISRALKTGGLVIFDYLDIEREEAWRFLRASAPELDNCFTYHSGTTINKVFGDLGFTAITRHQVGKNTYVAFRKSGGDK